MYKVQRFNLNSFVKNLEHVAVLMESSVKITARRLTMFGVQSLVINNSSLSHNAVIDRARNEK